MSISSNVARAKTDYDEVYKAAQDALWDSIQQNGNRANYEQAFLRWICPYIKPKYPIVTNNIYWWCLYNTELLEAPEVIASGDGLKTAYGAFSSCTSLKKCGDIKMSASAAADAIRALFDGCQKLETVGTITIQSSQNFLYTFRYCRNLVSVTFAGEIKSSGLDLSWSKKLNKASITSIINCLSTTTPEGLSVTLSLTAVKTAFNTTDPDTCTEWQALKATKSNWIISLQDS